MATTADFKNGMCLDIDGNYFFIVEFLHVKPGKGPAFVRTKLKNVKTGRVLDKTWNSGVKVDPPNVHDFSNELVEGASQPMHRLLVEMTYWSWNLFYFELVFCTAVDS